MWMSCVNSALTCRYEANSSVVAVTGVHQVLISWLSRCQPAMRTDAPSEKMPSATVATIVVRQSMKHRHESKKPVGQLRIHRSRVDCQSALSKDIFQDFFVTAWQKWLDIPYLMNADSFFLMRLESISAIRYLGSLLYRITGSWVPRRWRAHT